MLNGFVVSTKQIAFAHKFNVLQLDIITNLCMLSS